MSFQQKNIPFSGWKMSGWWFFATPLKNKILVSCGYEIPNIWNNKSNVPKHQPDVNSGIREDWFRLDSDPHTTSRIQWNPWYTKPPGIQIVLYNQSDNLWQSGTQRDRFLRKNGFGQGMPCNIRSSRNKASTEPHGYLFTNTCLP